MCRKYSHRVAHSNEDCLTFLAFGASKGELQASTDTTYMKNTVKGQYLAVMTSLEGRYMQERS
jgi:hypothetical protein